MFKKNLLSLFLLSSIFAINAGNLSIGETSIRILENENIFSIQVDDAINAKDFEMTEDSVYAAIETDKTLFCIYLENNLLEFYDNKSNGKMRIQAPLNLDLSTTQVWIDEENNLWTIEICKIKQEKPVVEEISEPITEEILEIE